jgi:hypothetical protein
MVTRSLPALIVALGSPAASALPPGLRVVTASSMTAFATGLETALTATSPVLIEAPAGGAL